MKYIFIVLCLSSCKFQHCETVEEYKQRLNISSHWKQPQIDSLEDLITISIHKQEKLSSLEWVKESLNEIDYRNKQLRYMLDELDSINKTKPIKCQ